MEKLSEDLIPNYILEDFHEHLYNEVYSSNIEVDDNEIGHITVEYERDGWFLVAEVECSMTFIEDSFTHEFGTYHDGHYEFRQIEDIDVSATYYKEDNGVEINVQFPYNRFNSRLFDYKNDENREKKLYKIIDNL